MISVSPGRALCENQGMSAEPVSPGPLTQRLLDLLVAHGVDHRLLQHPPVRTSEEASRVRGTPLEAGAKALVCHADDRIVLIVVERGDRLDDPWY